MTYSFDATASAPKPQQDDSSSQYCWSCSAHLTGVELFCLDCGKVQPLLSNVSYFEVFGLPRHLQLDLAALERDFYRLSRKLHPDVYARASQQEQDWSLANSSLLNDAYRTLKDPLRRTEYLLKLEGVLGADSAGGKKEDRVPADLLEEVFELNMQLDEMRINRQMGEDDPLLHKDLLAAKENFDAQLKSSDATLEGLWDDWDQSLQRGQEQKQAVKEKLAALLDRRRYLHNLVNNVNEALGI